MRKSALFQAVVLAAAMSTAGTCLAAADKPFEMPQVQRPVFPDKTFNIKDYGAVGDGKTMNTSALQKAVAACIQAGGGRVVVPTGTFVTGPFELGSNVALDLQKEALLQGSGNFDDYKQPGEITADITDSIATEFVEVMRPLISAHGATNVAILGQGTIDGAGQAWWKRTRAEEKAGASSPGQPHVPGKPVMSPRPHLIQLTDCRNIHVQGVTLRNPPKYNLAPYRCDTVVVEDATIQAPSDSPNTDGIDPANCRNVLIQRCRISVGDDQVSFKSNKGQPILENVLVTDCVFGGGHGVSVGSSTAGGIRNITVQRCAFSGTSIGIRIKSARDRGNIIENITYRDITIDKVGTAILINLFYFDGAAQKKREKLPVTPSTPIVRHIRIERVKVTGAKRAGEVIGLPEMPVTDLVLDHVRIEAGTGLIIQDAAKLDLQAVEIQAKQGEPITIQHSEAVQQR